MTWTAVVCEHWQTRLHLGTCQLQLLLNVVKHFWAMAHRRQVSRWKKTVPLDFEARVIVGWLLQEHGVFEFIPAGKYRSTSEMHTTRFLQVDETPNCNLLCKGASADGCKAIDPARWGTLWEYRIHFSYIAQWFALCTTSSWPQGAHGLIALSPLPSFAVFFQLCNFCQLKCSCNCMFGCILHFLTFD